MADWTNFSPEKTMCQFFLKGIKCEESKKVCNKFSEENPEEDSNQLINQLKNAATADIYIAPHLVAFHIFL